MLSERGHFVLKGDLFCRLAPLLDGRHRTDSIIAELAPHATPAQVHYALLVLRRNGYNDDGEAGADVVTPVSVARFGAVLASARVEPDDRADAALVLTDDYLQPGLGGFNAAALAAERRWLLARPVGEVLWVGAVFQPGGRRC